MTAFSPCYIVMPNYFWLRSINFFITNLYMVNTYAQCHGFEFGLIAVISLCFIFQKIFIWSIYDFAGLDDPFRMLFCIIYP